MTEPKRFYGYRQLAAGEKIQSGDSVPWCSDKLAECDEHQGMTLCHFHVPHYRPIEPPPGFGIVPESELDQVPPDGFDFGWMWTDGTRWPHLVSDFKKTARQWFALRHEHLAYARPIRQSSASTSSEPAQPDPRREWVHRDTRMPTKEDANSEGQVVWCDSDGWQALFMADQSARDDYTHWRTPFDPPKPEPEPDVWIDGRRVEFLSGSIRLKGTFIPNETIHEIARRLKK